MNIYTLYYCFLGLLRNIRSAVVASLMTLSTLAVSLILFGVFAVAAHNGSDFITNWGRYFPISLYLVSAPAEKEIGKLLETVHGMNGVDSALYVSSRQALERFRNDLGEDASLLDGTEEDVIPSSIEVRLKPSHFTMGRIEMLEAEFRSLPGVAEVEYGKHWLRTIVKLYRFFGALGVALGALIFFATALIVSNTIHLSIMSRREEIAVMKLVGATNGFVKAPFIMEGFLWGALGSVLALGALKLMLGMLSERFADALSFVSHEARLEFLPAGHIVLLCCCGVAMGVAGSIFSTSYHLRD